MELQLADRPYVPVTVNGTGPWWFILDTGNVGVGVDESVVEAMRLERERPDADTVAIPWFRVDEVERRGIRFGVFDYGWVRDICGRDVPGIVGMWLVMQTRLTLDYRAATGACRELVNVGPLPDGVRVPVELCNYYPIVRVFIDGKGPLNFMLDTGAAACMLACDAADRLGIERGAERPRRHPDAKPKWDVTVSRFAMGDAELRDHAIVVTDCSHLPEYTGRPVDGLVGHRFLQTYRVTFSLPDGCVVLQ